MTGPQARYRPAQRGDEWQDLSLRLRVEEWRCRVCGRQPTAPKQLQAAHLVAESHLWRLGLRDRYLFDERNLAVLCRPCHRAFDLALGVLRAERMPKGTVTRLRRRFAALEAAFAELLQERAAFLALLRSEAADGAGGRSVGDGDGSGRV